MLCETQLMLGTDPDRVHGLYAQACDGVAEWLVFPKEGLCEPDCSGHTYCPKCADLMRLTGAMAKAEPLEDQFEYTLSEQGVELMRQTRESIEAGMPRLEAYRRARAQMGFAT